PDRDDAGMARCDRGLESVVRDGCGRTRSARQSGRHRGGVAGRTRDAARDRLAGRVDLGLRDACVVRLSETGAVSGYDVCFAPGDPARTGRIVLWRADGAFD